MPQKNLSLYDCTNVQRLTWMQRKQPSGHIKKFSQNLKIPTTSSRPLILKIFGVLRPWGHGGHPDPRKFVVPWKLGYD